MSEPVAVQIACPCPAKPHEQDTVYLRPKMGLAGGAAMQALFTDKLREASEAKHNPDWNAITGWMKESYLLNGVVAWSLVDEQGQALAVSPESIRSVLLEDFELSEPVAQRGDDLYYDAVLAPLVKRLSESLRPSQTNGSTSPTKSSKTKRVSPRSRSTRRSLKPPTPLRPSSTSTIPTDSTEETSGALGRASTG